jgi:hypothetical protein
MDPAHNEKDGPEGRYKAQQRAARAELGPYPSLVSLTGESHNNEEDDEPEAPQAADTVTLYASCTQGSSSSQRSFKRHPKARIGVSFCVGRLQQLLEHEVTLWSNRYESGLLVAKN